MTPVLSLKTMRTSGRSASRGVAKTFRPAPPPPGEIGVVRADGLAPTAGPERQGGAGSQYARAPEGHRLRSPVSDVVHEIPEQPGRGSVEQPAGDAPLVVRSQHVRLD